MNKCNLFFLICEETSRELVSYDLYTNCLVSVVDACTKMLMALLIQVHITLTKK